MEVDGDVYNLAVLDASYTFTIYLFHCSLSLMSGKEQRKIDLIDNSSILRFEGWHVTCNLFVLLSLCLFRGT